MLRSICPEIAGLHVVPQRTITSVAPLVRPDLVDEDLRIVIEAVVARQSTEVRCSRCGAA